MGLMQAVRKYQIISGRYPGDLATAVNEEIAEGWQPQGGVFEYHHPDGDLEILGQAMVKMEETILGYPVMCVGDFERAVIEELKDIGSEFYS
jgi:hypothetical protein